MDTESCDVAIVGGGPAGMQAALVLARTRKHVIVFDAPEPPRNGASHGVHNVFGLDGLLPSAIREQAWRQIEVYHSAELRNEAVVDVRQDVEHGFHVVGSAGSSVSATHVILAMGYRDHYPDVPGFMACWGDTIITCPYCDGYENRDRVWGIVATTRRALEHLPQIYRNWTSIAKLFLPPDVPFEADEQAALGVQGISVYKGQIIEVHHADGRVEAVTLDTGETVAVDALLWRPPEEPVPLTRKLIKQFALDLDATGHILTDAVYQTQIKGLWAVGDLKGWAGTLGAAFAAHQTAVAITQIWYHNHALSH